MKDASKYVDETKRQVDVAVSVLALLVAAVPMAVIAVLIRLRMGGPVLFRQVRPGLHGAPFVIYKFRTMTVARPGAQGSAGDAARITPLGRVLRATSLDELPEFYNVLRGDMSLVGPRPLLMAYLTRYTPQQARRHEVRPGITGLAQVAGRNAQSWEERLALDVAYVEQVSPLLDLRIVARTLWQVVARTGISAPGHATKDEFQGDAN